MIGKTISHYKILEKIGTGGMGVVYKAEDSRLRRKVALKFLPPNLTRDEKAKQRFIHEAQAASTLDHPNICNIHEIDETEDGQVFICMACYEGQTLREKIEEGPLQLEEAMNIAIQVTQGLSKAHAKGIIHRDIKPGNIYVTEDGRVKILDFGLAILAGQTRLTKADNVPGTAAYMSPEQTRGTGVDPRTDIWSLGVVLYEMLTGQTPFRGEYDQAVLYSILHEEPPPLEGLREDIPDYVRSIIKKSLQKDPDDRYSSVGEVLQVLQSRGEKLKYRRRLRFSGPGKSRVGRSAVFFAAIILVLIAIVLVARHRKGTIEPWMPVDRIPIGVMFFDNQTSDQKYDYMRKVLADMLITDLSQSKFLQVMTFPRMFELMRSLGYEGVEIIDAAMGFELCKLAGAHVMVQGSLMKSGETFVINTQILDVDTKTQVDAYRVTGQNEDSILGHMVDDLTKEIKKALEISIREIQREEKNITALTTTSLEAYKYYFTGREAAFRMHNQEAIGDFQEAVALDSTFIEAYDALARQYYFIGETGEALQVIERVKSFSNKLTEEKLLEILSLEALLREDWELAVTYLTRLIDSHPENMKAHIDLGMVYYQRKLMYDKGISEFKKALKLDPQGVSHRTGFVYNVLGYAYLRKGERDKAGEAFEKYVSLLPNQAYPLTSLGDFYCMVGEYDAALLRLEQAVEIKPDYSLPYLYLGETYLEKGMYAQARQSYEKSLQLSISDAQKGEIYGYLGNLHFLSGEYDQATGWCQRALDLNSQMIEAHWTLGRIYAKSGMLAEAEDQVRKIKRLVEQTQTEEMKKYYHHLMGELNLGKGLFQEAVESFHRAAEIKSLEPAFYQSAVAMGYFRAGKLSRAMEQLESVLRINPNYVPAHYLLGVICEQEGREAEARHHFAEYLRIWESADEHLPQLAEVKKRLEEL